MGWNRCGLWVLVAACGSTSPEGGEGSTTTGGTTGENEATEPDSSTGTGGSTTTSGPGSEGSTGDGESTGAVGSSGTDGTTGEPLDCDDLPPLPTEYEIVSGPESSEDFVLNADGELLQVVAGDLLVGTYGAPSTLLYPGVSQGYAASIRILDNGDIVFANGTGGVTRVGAGGTTQLMVGGLSFPNGLAIDDNNTIYVGELSAGRILTLEPDTLAVETVVSGFSTPNGMAFTQDYQTLYFGTLDSSIYRLDIATSDLELVVNPVGNGLMHGFVTDRCDSLYLSDPTAIYRLRDDVLELIVDFDIDPGPAQGAVITNMHFGSGVGDWDASSMYLMDITSGDLIVLEIGIPGTPYSHL